MMNLEEENGIQELSTWNMPDTVSKPDGYDMKTLPEATADNMVIMMEKINQLVTEVNRLNRLNKGLIEALKQFYLLQLTLLIDWRFIAIYFVLYAVKF